MRASASDQDEDGRERALKHVSTASFAFDMQQSWILPACLFSSENYSCSVSAPVTFDAIKYSRISSNPSNFVPIITMNYVDLVTKESCSPLVSILTSGCSRLQNFSTTRKNASTDFQSIERIFGKFEGPYPPPPLISYRFPST